MSLFGFILDRSIKRSNQANPCPADCAWLEECIGLLFSYAQFLPRADLTGNNERYIHHPHTYPHSVHLQYGPHHVLQTRHRGTILTKRAHRLSLDNVKNPSSVEASEVCYVRGRLIASRRGRWSIDSIVPPYEVEYYWRLAHRKESPLSMSYRDTYSGVHTLARVRLACFCSERRT